MTNLKLTKSQIDALGSLLIALGQPVKAAKPMKASKQPKAAVVKVGMAAATVAAFAAAGYGQVTPNVDVLTYDGWKAKGFLVNKGQKSVRVKLPGMTGKGYPLFCAAQVSPIAA